MKATKNNSVERVLPPKGNHLAVVSQIIDWGTVKDSYGSRRKVEFISELPEHTHVFDEEVCEMPIIIDRKFANNLGSAKRPSGLREFIEGITGEEVGDVDEFELEDLLGLVYRVNIVIKSDGEYKNASQTAYSQASDKEKKVNKVQGESFVFDLENFDKETFGLMPTWKQGEISKSPEYKALGLKPIASNNSRVEEDEEEEQDEKPKKGVAKKQMPAPKKGQTVKGKKLL